MILQRGLSQWAPKRRVGCEMLEGAIWQTKVAAKWLKCYSGRLLVICVFLLNLRTRSVGLNHIKTSYSNQNECPNPCVKRFQDEQNIVPLTWKYNLQYKISVTERKVWALLGMTYQLLNNALSLFWFAFLPSANGRFSARALVKLYNLIATLSLWPSGLHVSRVATMGEACWAFEYLVIDDDNEISNNSKSALLRLC